MNPCYAFINHINTYIGVLSKREEAFYKENSEQCFNDRFNQINLMGKKMSQSTSYALKMYQIG